VDVQEKCLFYVVVAFRNDFSGHVIDYGCFPDQNLYYFTLNTLKVSLFDIFANCGQEAAWRKGFEALCNTLCETEYIRDDGASMRISRLLIDANQGQASNTIYDYCKQSKHAGIVMPSRGIGVTASMKPFSDYKRSAGDFISPHNWRIPSVTGKSNNCRYILSDVNYWKSFTRSRIKTAVGDSGSLTIFGKPEQHQMLIEQLCSEYSITTTGRGRTVDEWKMRQFSYDNHYWDCLVGCHIAASEQGIVLGGTVAVGKTSNSRNRLERLSRLGRVRQ
jgi:phage terminase large subunit GpA-like protein